jgi:hypothetical protein
LFPPTRAPRERSTALSCATVSDSTRTKSDRSADVDAARDDDDDDGSAFFLVPSSAASDAEVARGEPRRAGVVGNGANRANRRVGGDARRARAGATPLSRAAHGGW